MCKKLNKIHQKKIFFLNSIDHQKMFIKDILCETINGRPIYDVQPFDKYHAFMQARVAKGVSLNYSSVNSVTQNVSVSDGSPILIPTPELVLISAYDKDSTDIFINADGVKMKDSTYEFKYDPAIESVVVLIYNRNPSVSYTVIYEIVTDPYTVGGISQLNSTEALRSGNNIIISQISDRFINSISDSVCIGINGMYAPEFATSQEPDYQLVRFTCTYNSEPNSLIITDSSVIPFSIRGPYILSHCLGLADTQLGNNSEIGLYSVDDIRVGTIDLTNIYSTSSEIKLDSISTLDDTQFDPDNDQVFSFSLEVDMAQLELNNSQIANNVAIGNENYIVGGKSTVIGGDNTAVNNCIIIGSTNESQQDNGIGIGSDNKINVKNSILIGKDNICEHYQSIILGEQNQVSDNHITKPTIKITDANTSLFNQLTNGFKYGQSSVAYVDEIYEYCIGNIRNSGYDTLVNGITYSCYYIEGKDSGPSGRVRDLWSILTSANAITYNGINILPQGFSTQGEPKIDTTSTYTILLDYINNYVLVNGTLQNGSLTFLYYRLKSEMGIYQTDIQLIGYNNKTNAAGSLITGNNNSVNSIIPDQYVFGNIQVIGETSKIVVGHDNEINGLCGEVQIVGSRNLINNPYPNEVVSSPYINLLGCNDCTLLNSINASLIACQDSNISFLKNCTIIGANDNYTDFTDFTSGQVFPQNTVLLGGMLNFGGTVKRLVTISTIDEDGYIDEATYNTMVKCTDVIINTIDQSTNSPLSIQLDIQTLDQTIGRVYNFTLLLGGNYSVELVAAGWVTNSIPDASVYVPNDINSISAGDPTHLYLACPIVNIRSSFTLTCIGSNKWLFSGSFTPTLPPIG